MPRTRKQARMEEAEQVATAAKEKEAENKRQAAVLSRILMDPVHEDLCHIIMEILFEEEKKRIHAGIKCSVRHRPVTMLMMTSMQMVVSNISLIMINTMQRYIHQRYQEYIQAYLANKPLPGGTVDQTMRYRLKVYEWTIGHAKTREIALAKWRKINMMREEMKKLREENEKLRARS